jgi:hypothetical protein
VTPQNELEKNVRIVNCEKSKKAIKGLHVWLDCNRFSCRNAVNLVLHHRHARNVTLETGRVSPQAKSLETGKGPHLLRHESSATMDRWIEMTSSR